jgi:hypothetical protein
MPEPSIRERIMAVIGERLAVIRTASGYNTDAGVTITYGRLESPTPDEVPCINYWDGNAKPALDWGPDSRAVTVTVEGYNQIGDGVLPTIANRMLADIETAILQDVLTGDVDPWVADLIQRIEFVESVPLLLPGAPALGGVVVEYELIYRQALGDPSSLDA